MNIIKGLITKDLLQLKNYRKTLILFIFVFLCTGLIQENANGVIAMTSIMLTLGFGMFGVATFNYDEQAKTNGYILTFPLSKKEIVLSKYILIICATIIGAILGMILSIIINVVMSFKIPNIYELITTILAGILGIGIIEAIQIPCIYKWGAEKGRIQIFVIAAIIVLLIGGFFLIGNEMNIKLPIENMLSIVMNYLPIILILATIIIYYISYRISIRIYNNIENL